MYLCLDWSAYDESVKACRRKYLILGDSIESWDPSKEGVWELWEYGRCIFLPLPSSVERRPSWSQETKGKKGGEAKGDGDDGLSDDVSLILTLALIFVAIVIGHRPSRHYCGTGWFSSPKAMN